MGLPANISKLRGGLQAAAAAAKRASGGELYMKLEKSGDYVYGADDTPTEPEALWAVNPMTISTGYQAWKDGEFLGEEMAELLNEAPVVKSALPDVGAPWRECAALELTCTDGEDEGVQVLFKLGTVGGMKAFGELVQAIDDQMDEDPEKCVPLIKLESGNYKHKKYGKITFPVLTVVKWATMDTTKVEDAEDVEVEEVEEETPPARKSRRRK